MALEELGREEFKLVLTLSVPVTVFSPSLGNDGIVMLERYYGNVLNGADGEMLCFNGDLVRHALKTCIKGGEHFLKMADSVFVGHQDSEKIGVRLEVDVS